MKTVIEMAREAGGSETMSEWMTNFLERFAALVREDCIKVCEDYLEAAKNFSDDDYRTGQMQAALDIKAYIRRKGER